MTTDGQMILAGAMDFVYRCEILHREKDYIIDTSLGEETGTLVNQSPYPDGDISINP